MEFLKNSTQPVEPGRVVVTGATLSEAFNNVRDRFGLDAVITGTRTRRPRGSDGDPATPVVEVTVATREETGQPRMDLVDSPGSLTAEIRYEVERLERMVEDIIKPQPKMVDLVTDEGVEYPLAEFLVRRGASIGAVDRLLTRFAGETGQPKSDRPGAISWLGENLGEGPGPLTQWRGTHAIIGENATERLDLVLRLAAHLTEAGRRVLAVAVLPDPDRDIHRLQNLAEAAGFDAAVVRDPEQLTDLEADLQGYDLVLVDLPALADPAMDEGGTIHRVLSTKTGIQRHLRLSLDRDFMDLDELRDAAHFWGCDWWALDRMEGSRRPAKILDLVESVPLPVSLLADDSSIQGYVTAASVDLLLDRIFAQGDSPKFTPGLKAANV